MSITETFLYKGDSAQAALHLHRAAQIQHKQPENKNAAWFYIIKSKFSRLIENPKEVAAAIDTGFYFARKLNQRYDSSTLVFERFYLHKMTGNLELAKQVLVSILKDSIYIKSQKNHLSLLYELAQIEYALGNYQSATEVLFAYKEKRDTATQADFTEAISKMEAGFRTAEKEREIQNLKEKANAQKRKKQLEMLVLSLVIALLCAIIGFIILQLRNRKRAIKGQKEIFEAQMQTLAQQKHADGLVKLMQGQNLERERVARDLHDSLGGMLSGIKLNLSAAEASASDADPIIKKTIERLDVAVRELRLISNNLSPDALLRNGMEKALRQYALQIESPSTKIDSQFINFTDNLSNEQSLMMYRIAQELLNNAVRHARAQNVLLQVQQSDEQIFLTVEDDGIGFDVAQVKSESQGLGNVQHRVDFLNGSIDISSSPNVGTTITITLPIHPGNPT